ncbi:MAG: dihydropteroate synthase [Lewinellaceae bacterium]|jgi:dihydropteroate synthase|nr:dihydropteroate synthase [Lewinellaceae bacterium]
MDTTRRHTLRCRDRILELDAPVVMGILNTTPDSFYDGGLYQREEAVVQRAGEMLQQGAMMLDIGGASTRPGAKEVPEQEEMKRVVPLITAILKRYPQALLSVDTWRASVAKAAIDAGAALVNDISAGRLDPDMYKTVAGLDVPYVLMHMQGTPGTMQQHPNYKDVVTEVLDFFIQETGKLHALGIKDIILDPGFGFGKTVEHNYLLLNNMHVFSQVLGMPVLAGISRKSMICRVLNVSPADALNGTTALHMPALQQGVKILRVHDVREAMETIRLWQMTEKVKNRG